MWRSSGHEGELLRQCNMLYVPPPTGYNLICDAVRISTHKSETCWSCTESIDWSNTKKHCCVITDEGAKVKQWKKNNRKSENFQKYISCSLCIIMVFVLLFVYIRKTGDQVGYIFLCKYWGKVSICICVILTLKLYVLTTYYAPFLHYILCILCIISIVAILFGMRVPYHGWILITIVMDWFLLQYFVFN
jgi:hypothetical protein